MMDPSAVTIANTFSNLIRIVQGLRDVATSAEVKACVTELYDIIIAGQQSALENNIKQQAMLDRIHGLEEELGRVMTWETTKIRYALIEAMPNSGIYVYARKKSGGPSEPPHWICTKCYQDGELSILQVQHVLHGRQRFLTCPRCKTSIDATRYIESKPEYVSE